jgi:2-methylcitrate dehydratase PrpD
VKLRLAEPWASAYPVSWGGRVTLRLRNGGEYIAEREHARGDPEAPLSRDQMIEKALMLLRHGGTENPERLVEGLLSMASGGRPPALDIG